MKKKIKLPKKGKGGLIDNWTGYYENGGEYNWEVTPRMSMSEGGIIEMKEGGWIKKAINPKHKGYCTPMTKSTCTPRRKALAKRFKKGGDLHKAELGDEVPTFNPGDEGYAEQQALLNQPQVNPVTGVQNPGFNPGLTSFLQNQYGKGKKNAAYLNQYEANQYSNYISNNPNPDYTKGVKPNMNNYWMFPYYAGQAQYGQDDLKYHQDIKKQMDMSNSTLKDRKAINTSIAGNRLQMAGGIMGQTIGDIYNIVGGIGTGLKNQRVLADEQAIRMHQMRNQAQINPYYGDSSELGNGTRSAYAENGAELPCLNCGGKMTLGGKLGYLEYGGINNGNGKPNVKTERGEITNNTDHVFKEGGDLHSDPSGGNTRSYAPGTVVHSDTIGLEAKDAIQMLPMLPGGDFAAKKIKEKYGNSSKNLTYADMAKPFITKELDTKLKKVDKDMEKEDLYATSNNETKISRVTSQLNLKTLAKKAAELKLERDMNIAMTGPDGPIHNLSESLKKSGAYGNDVKQEALKQEAKYGSEIPDASGGTVVSNWVDPTPAQYRKIAAMEWLGQDEPNAAQKAKGLQKGFNTGIDAKLLVGYLKNAGYTPPNNDWDQVTQQGLQDYVYDWDTKSNNNKIKEYLYNQYLPTIQGLDWFKQKGYKPDTPFYQLDPQDIDKVFKDQKLGVRFGTAAGLMGIGKPQNSQAPVDTPNDTPYTPSQFQAPNLLKTKKRPYYVEGLNPAQVAGPLMDLFASKQAVPYIEDQGAKQALAANTRQRFTDIQPQLNRITRGVRAITQRNPTDSAANAQIYSNAWEAANQVYGQKYNMDNQIEQNYNNMQNELLMRAGANKAQALNTLAERTATRDWKDYAMRRNAVGEIGNKYLQNLNENRASVLYQDMFPNFNYNPYTGTSYQGTWAPQIGSMFPYGGVGTTKDKGYTEEKYTDPETGHEVVKRIPNQKMGGKVKLPKSLPKKR